MSKNFIYDTEICSLAYMIKRNNHKVVAVSLGWASTEEKSKAVPELVWAARDPTIIEEWRADELFGLFGHQSPLLSFDVISHERIEEAKAVCTTVDHNKLVIDDRTDMRAKSSR